MAPHPVHRWPLAVALVLLAPLCAEYVIGYDTSTGDPLALLGGLLIFGPLYGAPALLIREVACRAGLRWPGVLSLCVAAGIAQAGLYDQSMFSRSYREIEYWADMVEPTFLEPLGISAFTAVVFVVGHAVWSFAVPIALVESLRPELRHEPWLRRTGLVVTTLLYLAAAALITVDHQQSEADHASPAQLVGAAVVMAGLVAFAATVGRRVPLRRDAAVRRPWVVGTWSLLAGLGFNVLPPQWSGVAVGITILAAVTWWVTRAGRSSAWTGQHVVALATGALAARALVAFVAVPLGDVPAVAKYAHNAAFLVGAIALGVWAARRVSEDATREVVRGRSGSSVRDASRSG